MANSFFEKHCTSLQRELSNTPRCQLPLKNQLYIHSRHLTTESHEEWPPAERGEQVSHKTLSALIAELELYGYIEVERKGRGRGRGADFYIYPTGSVERKVLLDALKDLVV